MPMFRVHLHESDLFVSALCFGAGDLGTRARGAEAERLVADFVEAGGDFFDTAHCYAFWVEDGLGASERELGRCLKQLGCQDHVVVATKGGHPDGGEAYRRPDRYLSPEVISRDVDESLERLGMDCVPVYYLHRDDTRVPVGEIVDALNQEVLAGNIGCLGASNWSVRRIADANEYAARKGYQGFVLSQVQWSLAEPTWEMGADPTMRFVTPHDAHEYAEMRVAVTAYTSTAAGYFAREDPAGHAFHTPANAARSARARDLAAQIGCTPTQIALAWVLHQRPLVIPVVGTLNRDHLAEAIGAVALRLPPAQVKWLRDGDGDGNDER